MVIRRYVNFHDLSKRLKVKETTLPKDDPEMTEDERQVATLLGKHSPLVKRLAATVFERRLVSKSSVVVYEDNPEEVGFPM